MSGRIGTGLSLGSAPHALFQISKGSQSSVAVISVWISAVDLVELGFFYPKARYKTAGLNVRPETIDRLAIWICLVRRVENQLGLLEIWLPRSSCGRLCSLVEAEQGHTYTTPFQTVGSDISSCNCFPIYSSLLC